MPKGLDVTSLLVETLRDSWRAVGIPIARLTVRTLLFVTINNLTVEVISISAVDCYWHDGS